MIPPGFAHAPEWSEPEAAPHDELALLHAQEWERRWVAERITDEPLQTLAQVSRLLQAAAEPGAPSALVRESAREALRLTQGVSDSLRSLARELRPSILDDFGIVRALRALTSEFGLRTGISARFALVGQPHSLGDDQELTCYRVAQQALGLIEDLGRATEVEVRLIIGAHGVRLLVLDDAGAAEGPRENRPPGWGLRPLRQRARMLGGSLRLRRFGSSTLVRLALPAPALPGPLASPEVMQSPGWGGR